MTGDDTCRDGTEHHTKLEEGRYYCEPWDEVVDFDLDPWGPDEPCPWCGERYEDTGTDDEDDLVTDGGQPVDGTERFRIGHLFADHGVESEVLATFGAVVRVTIEPHENPFVDETVQMNLMEETPDVDLDLALLHPKCTDKSHMTSISGDPSDHENQVARAREIAGEVAADYVIENRPRDDLREPTVLNGKMFGLPIHYERAFETSFSVETPPRERTLVEKTVSPYFFSDRTHDWWQATKGYRHRWPKEHLAKNALPAVYVQHLVRSWLEATNERDAQAVQDNNGRAPPKVSDDQATLVSAAGSGESVGTSTTGTDDEDDLVTDGGQPVDGTGRCDRCEEESEETTTLYRDGHVWATLCIDCHGTLAAEIAEANGTERVGGADREAEAEALVELFNDAAADYSPELEWFAMGQNHETMDESFVLEAEGYIDADGLTALRNAGRTVRYIEAYQKPPTDEVYCQIQVPVLGETVATSSTGTERSEDDDRGGDD